MGGDRRLTKGVVLRTKTLDLLLKHAGVKSRCQRGRGRFAGQENGWGKASPTLNTLGISARDRGWEEKIS